MRITSKTIRRRKQRIRELAAFWCSVLACDRATPAWSIKLLSSDIPTSRVVTLAWNARLAALSESANQIAIHKSAADNAAEGWARAESLLRTGWRPKS